MKKYKVIKGEKGYKRENEGKQPIYIYKKWEKDKKKNSENLKIFDFHPKNIYLKNE